MSFTLKTRCTFIEKFIAKSEETILPFPSVLAVLHVNILTFYTITVMEKRKYTYQLKVFI